MSYQSVHDYFDANPIPPCDTNEIIYEVRLDAAEDILWECFNANIQDFDCHDMIERLSIHFDVEKKDLLEYYDSL